MAAPDLTRLQVCCIVLITAFDEVPDHLFEVHSIEEDCVTGVALTGPLKGHYGEPTHAMIKAVQQR